MTGRNYGDRIRRRARLAALARAAFMVFALIGLVAGAGRACSALRARGEVGREARR